MIVALGYLRVSSDKQRERVTIDSQRRDVPAYIAAQGWTLGGLFEDDGRTAKAGHLDARDGFSRLLAACKAQPRGAQVVVVVVAVDRLTRSEDPVERAQVVASITATGAQIAIVGAGIQDPSTFAGDAYLTLQASKECGDVLTSRAMAPAVLRHLGPVVLTGAVPARTVRIEDIVARVDEGTGDLHAAVRSALTPYLGATLVAGEAGA